MKLRKYIGLLIVVDFIFDTFCHAIQSQLISTIIITGIINIGLALYTYDRQ
jgi:hypothetical protein